MIANDSHEQLRVGMKQGLGRRRVWLACSAALFSIGANTAWAAEDEETEAQRRAADSQDNIIVTGQREGYKAEETGTALKLPLSLRETPQSVTVVTRQQIEDFNLNTIADVLAQTPGITVSSVDSNRTTFFARGFAIQNFQIDGVPTVFQTSGYANSLLSDMSIYERVEVIRGAAGLGAGTGDPSGIVNLVRKSPKYSFGASANFTGGSWDYYRGEVDVTGPITSDGSVRARFVGAYTDKGSFVDFQHDTSPSVYAVIDADLTPNTTLRVGADYLETSSGGGAWGTVPLFFTDGTEVDLPRSYSASAPWAYWQREMVNVFGRVDQQLGGDWTARFAYNYRTIDANSLLFAGSAGFPNPDGTGMGVWNFFGANSQTENSFDAYLSGSVQLFGRAHEIVLGANHTKRELTVFQGGITTPLPPFDNIFDWDGVTPESSYTRSELADWVDHARETGVYGAIRLNPIDGVKIIAGGRYTDSTLYRENDGAEEVFEGQTSRVTGQRFTPYGGVIIDVLDNVSLFASYAALFRPQALRTIALEQLPPVTGTNYEAGVKAELFDKRLYVAATGFHMYQDNIAQRDPNDPFFPGTPPPGQETFYIPTPGVRTWGGEFEVSGSPLPGWNIAGGYTYSRSDNDDGRQFPAQPLHIARFNTTYDLGAALDGLVIGGGVAWQSEIYQSVSVPSGAFNPNGTPVLAPRRVSQGSYALINLMTRYNLTDNVQVGANVSNLLDRNYFRNIGANGYYGEPRRFMANLRYSFR